MGRGRSTPAKLIRDSLFLGLVVVVTLAGLRLGWKRLTDPYEGPPNVLLGDAKIIQIGFRSRCGRPTQGNEAIVVRVFHSDDKTEWIQHAATAFTEKCPNTQLSLIAMNDMGAIDAMTRDGNIPTMWVPTNHLSVQYLEERWSSSEQGIPLLLEQGPPLLHSPTVLFLWEDRFRVLSELIDRWDGRGEVWARSVCATLPFEPVNTQIPREFMVPGTWLEWRKRDADSQPGQHAQPSDAMLALWGRVAIRHPSPSRTSVGLAAIYLLAYDFLGERSTTGVLGEHDFRNALAHDSDHFQHWLRRCQAGLEVPLDSALLLTESMFHVGGDSYDGVVTSENLVFDVLDSINEHGSEMRPARIVYPEPTIVNDHPVVYLYPGDPTAKDSIEAARRFTAYLQTAPVQEEAVEHGLRPTNPHVVIREHDTHANPFLRLRSFGVRLEPKTVEPPPLDGAELRGLIELWEDATRRN